MPKMRIRSGRPSIVTSNVSPSTIFTTDADSIPAVSAQNTGAFGRTSVHPGCSVGAADGDDTAAPLGRGIVTVGGVAVAPEPSSSAHPVNASPSRTTSRHNDARTIADDANTPARYHA